MKISLNKFKYILIHSILWFITFIFFNIFYIDYTPKAFRLLCIYTLIMSILVLAIQIKCEKGVVKPFVIVLICFELFQIGLPMLYGADASYKNWNIEFFDIKNRINSLIFTMYCIHAFALGGSLGLSNSSKLMETKNQYLKNPFLIRKIAIFLSVITGIVAIPLSALIAILSMKNGYSYIKVDSMGINSGFTNMIRTVFPAAIFLLLIYSKPTFERKIILFFIFLYGGLSMAAGGRTVGLSMFLTLIYYFDVVKKSKQKKENKLLRNMIIGISVLLLLIILVLVKTIRTGQNIENLTLVQIIESVVEEMGFNFTSICFTKKYIPSTTGFQYGKSYLYALICLLPASFDPSGVINTLKQLGPEQWLATRLHASYGVTFDYGVGYSIIAESFYNFGNYGFLVVLLQGILIQKIFSIKFDKDDKFGLYVKVIMLWALTTYPRRSFFTLAKALEYDVLLVIIIISVIGRILKRGNVK